MNISERNAIRVTDDEWNAISADAKRRIKDIARTYVHSDGNEWYFYFYGISDKQTVTELCAYFGLKVTE